MSAEFVNVAFLVGFVLTASAVTVAQGWRRRVPIRVQLVADERLETDLWTDAAA